ncbi:hypothetical protein ES703_74167 [subsurface metagenome]
MVIDTASGDVFIVGDLGRSELEEVLSSWGKAGKYSCMDSYYTIGSYLCDKSGLRSAGVEKAGLVCRLMVKEGDGNLF